MVIYTCDTILTYNPTTNEVEVSVKTGFDVNRIISLQESSTNKDWTWLTYRDSNDESLRYLLNKKYDDVLNEMSVK